MKTKTWSVCLCSLTLAFGSAAYADGIVPDNGGGTADLPIHLDYYTIDDPMLIIDGLPAGTTIEIDAVLAAPVSTLEEPGGLLGGSQSAAIGSALLLNMKGTGALAGYNRFIGVPMDDLVSFIPPNPIVSFEVHSAPRTPFAAVQSFATDMSGLHGQVFGDPDFDLLEVTAGTVFGLPSPGHTTLTQWPGDQWAVDSFFDIMYRIDFVGAPGSVLSDQSGSTTGTARFATQPVPEPTTTVLLLAGAVALACPRIRAAALTARIES